MRVKKHLVEIGLSLSCAGAIRRCWCDPKMPLLVDPTRRLHLVTDEKSLKALIQSVGHPQPDAFAGNLRQVLAWTRSGGPSGERDRAKERDNWQQLVDVQYVQADGSLGVVAFVGKIGHKFKTMKESLHVTFAQGSLANLLNGSKPKLEKDDLVWRLLPRPPACVQQLGHGDTLVGLQAGVADSLLHEEPSLPDYGARNAFPCTSRESDISSTPHRTEVSLGAFPASGSRCTRWHRRPRAIPRATLRKRSF